MNWLNIALLVSSVPVLGAALYLAGLALASHRARPLASFQPKLRFTFLVPAHNEERGLARTLESMKNVTWPRDMFRIHVVADNCTDATATVARACGADVTERQDAERRGKGYALSVGVAACMADGFTDALVVVDADSTVDANFLSTMQAHIENGAAVVQARYGVLNTEDGWRVRLMDLALALFHDVRSRGRQALGLSTGLRGNGMCFTRDALARFPLRCTSLVEDVEQGIVLGRAGVQVHHAMETSVLGEMPSQGPAAKSQRLRWEHGRVELRNKWLSHLFSRAWEKKSALLMDLALDLALPPFTTLVLVAALGWLTAATAGALGYGTEALVAWTAAVMLLVFYVANGVALSKRGWRAWIDLGAAPAFVAWKVALAVHSSVTPSSWVRTQRSGEKP